MLAPEAALPTASSPGLPRTKDTGQNVGGTPRLAYPATQMLWEEGA